MEKLGVLSIRASGNCITKSPARYAVEVHKTVDNIASDMFDEGTRRTFDLNEYFHVFVRIRLLPTDRLDLLEEPQHLLGRVDLWHLRENSILSKLSLRLNSYYETK